MPPVPHRRTRSGHGGPPAGLVRPRQCRLAGRRQHGDGEIVAGWPADAGAEAGRSPGGQLGEAQDGRENHHPAGYFVLVERRNDPRNIIRLPPSDRGLSLGRDDDGGDRAVAVGDRMVCARRERVARPRSQNRRRPRQRRQPRRPRPGRRLEFAAATTPPRRRCGDGNRRQQHHDHTADRPDDSGGGHRPTGQRRRDQPQVQPDRADVHRRHTWTARAASPAARDRCRRRRRADRRCVNRPLASRQATIAAAVTGPTPGRVSSCSTVAVFRSTKPPGAEALPRVVGAPGGAAVLGSDLMELPIAVGVARRRRDTDDDLLTVGDPAGHVQPHQVGAVERTAGGGDRVGDPCARLQGHQTGLVHQADHAHDHRLVGVGRGAGSESDWPTKPSVPAAVWPIPPAAVSSRTRVNTVTSTATTPTTAQRHNAGPSGVGPDGGHPARGIAGLVSGSHRDNEVSGFVVLGSVSASFRLRDGGAVARRAVRFACARR